MTTACSAFSLRVVSGRKEKRGDGGCGEREKEEARVSGKQRASGSSYPRGNAALRGGAAGTRMSTTVATGGGLQEEGDDVF